MSRRLMVPLVAVVLLSLAVPTGAAKDSLYYSTELAASRAVGSVVIRTQARTQGEQRR